jgi:hypothetical protein
MALDALNSLRQMEGNFPNAYKKFMECASTASNCTLRKGPSAYAQLHGLMKQNSITALAYQALEVMRQQQNRNSSMYAKLSELDQKTLNTVAIKSHSPANSEHRITDRTWTLLVRAGIANSSNTLSQKTMETVRRITSITNQQATLL